MADRGVLRIRELLAGEDHGNPHGGQQAGEGQLDPRLRVEHLVVLKEVVDPLVPKAANVMRGDVVDRLGTVGEQLLSVTVAQLAAVDQLLNGRFEAGLTRRFLAEDGVADQALEGLIPQSVEAALPQERSWQA